MALTILVTGFGPFPGAPFNPTGPLVERLARLRRLALANEKFVLHIFPTSYAAVDRDLPKLIERHKPDALLMFGLAPRARALRIETRARNTVSLLPDAGGIALRRLTIAASGPAALVMPAPTHRLLAAVRAALLVSDDPAGGIGILRRTEADLAHVDGVTLDRGMSIVADALRFSVSDVAASVRRRIGRS